MHRDLLGCKVGAVGLQGECYFKFVVEDKMESLEITLLEGETL
jgi:hypothetical protein